MIETVQGIVLRSEDVDETDKRLTLYTKELGKIRARVVGARKTASKLRILTMPFSESRFQVYLHGTKREGLKDPGKIIGGEPIEFFTGIRADLDKISQAAALTETLDALTHSLYANPKEYELLRSALEAIELSQSPVLVRLRSTLILLKIMGYSLRHHVAWTSYPEHQKSLLKKLARWNGENELFSEYETETLKHTVHDYLSMFLDRPLKTLIFQQKMEAVA
jgi:DNA repair protein RecO